MEVYQVNHFNTETHFAYWNKDAGYIEERQNPPSVPKASTFEMATSVLKLLPVLPTVFASLVVFLLPVNKDDNSANHTIKWI